MRKADELADPTSCMNRARDLEWTFVLLGRDRAAPAAVRAWIEERIRLGKNTPNDAQIREAAAWIDAVEEEQGVGVDSPFRSRTQADAISETDRLLAETFDQLDPEKERDAWFLTRITKIREALADRPKEV